MAEVSGSKGAEQRTRYCCHCREKIALHVDNFKGDGFPCCGNSGCCIGRWPSWVIQSFEDHNSENKSNVEQKVSRKNLEQLMIDLGVPREAIYAIDGLCKELDAANKRADEAEAALQELRNSLKPR